MPHEGAEVAADGRAVRRCGHGCLLSSVRVPPRRGRATCRLASMTRPARRRAGRRGRRRSDRAGLAVACGGGPGSAVRRAGRPVTGRRGPRRSPPGRSGPRRRARPRARPCRRRAPTTGRSSPDGGHHLVADGRAGPASAGSACSCRLRAASAARSARRTRARAAAGAAGPGSVAHDAPVSSGLRRPRRSATDGAGAAGQSRAVYTACCATATRATSVGRTAPAGLRRATRTASAGPSAGGRHRRAPGGARPPRWRPGPRGVRASRPARTRNGSHTSSTVSRLLPHGHRQRGQADRPAAERARPARSAPPGPAGPGRARPRRRPAAPPGRSPR